MDRALSSRGSSGALDGPFRRTRRVPFHPSCRTSKAGKPCPQPPPTTRGFAWLQYQLFEVRLDSVTVADRRGVQNTARRAGSMLGTGPVFPPGPAFFNAVDLQRT